MNRVAWATTCLVVLVALHAWGALHSPTRLWAFDAMRYLAPWFAWASWLVAAVVLVRPVARAAETGIDRLGSFRGWPLAIVAALAAWCLDDRTQFIGDFMLRQQ